MGKDESLLEKMNSTKCKKILNKRFLQSMKDLKIDVPSSRTFIINIQAGGAWIMTQKTRSQKQAFEIRMLRVAELIVSK